jgi:hypothetical protein
LETGFWIFIFLFISGICLFPFGFSCFYIFLGIKNYFIGRKEKSREKIVGGRNTIVYAVLGVLVSVVVWLILYRVFLSWEI